jgi:exodeoxyribonuclease VII large subunit
LSVKWAGLDQRRDLQFQPAPSGHWYFTLKDDNAQVRCAMFRNSNRRVTFRPQHGQQVLVRANITLYEPRGDYQIIVEHAACGRRSAAAEV